MIVAEHMIDRYKIHICYKLWISDQMIALFVHNTHLVRNDKNVPIRKSEKKTCLIIKIE